MPQRPDILLLLLCLAVFIAAVPFTNDPHSAPPVEAREPVTPTPLDAAASAPRTLSAAPGDQRLPSAAPDGKGGAIVVWEDYRLGESDLYVQSVSRTGTPGSGWPEGGLPLCTESGAQYVPRAVADGHGGAVIVWTDARADESDIYASRITASGSIATSWSLDGNPICTAAGLQHDPVVVSDPTGGALIAWVDQRRTVPAVFVQRVDGDGEVAAGWPADGVPVTEETRGQGAPVIVAAGNGGAFVAWEEAREGVPHIYLMHFDDHGRRNVGWPDAGLRVCANASRQVAVCAVANGRGGITLAWVDGRDEATAIYATSIGVDGSFAPGFGEDGVRVCSDAGNQSAPTMIALPQGTLVAWEDARRGDSDVYGQLVTSAGAVAEGWPRAGLGLCTAIDDQIVPQLAIDGAGGALALWVDYRHGNPRVYVQRVTAAGRTAPGWTDQGTRLLPQSADHYAPVMVSNGTKGAVVAWSEGSVDSDLRAAFVAVASAVAMTPPQRGGAEPIAAAGAVDFDASPAERRFTLGLDGFRPNPARDGASVSFSLDRDVPATVEVRDIGGRRLVAEPVGRYGPGRHLLRLDSARLPPGVYVIRLVQGERTLTARGSVVR